MQNNLSGQLTILKSQLEELAISFGDMLMPVIRRIVTAIQGFVDKLNNMSEGQREAILKVGLLVAALGPFLVILGTVISKVGVAMQGFVKLAGAFGKLKTAMSAGTGIMGKLGAALGGISAPVLAVVAVIAVLVAAFVHLWNTNEGFREAIIGTWEKIKSTVSNFVEGIRERLASLGISFSDIAETIKAIWNGLCAVLAPVFEGAFSYIANVLEAVLGVITGIFDVFIGIFTGDWEQAWNGVKEIFGSLWEGIKSHFEIIINTIKGIADAVLGWFGTSWNEVWSGIKSFFEGIWNGIVSFFEGIWNAITDTVSAALNAVSTAISTVWNAIKTTISTILNAIKTAVTTAWNAIKTAVPRCEYRQKYRQHGLERDKEHDFYCGKRHQECGIHGVQCGEIHGDLRVQRHQEYGHVRLEQHQIRHRDADQCREGCGQERHRQDQGVLQLLLVAAEAEAPAPLHHRVVLDYSAVRAAFLHRLVQGRRHHDQTHHVRYERQFSDGRRRGRCGGDPSAEGLLRPALRHARQQAEHERYGEVPRHHRGQLLQGHLS